MKKQKFDLDQVINGTKVVTRDGKEIKQLTCFDASNNYDYHLYGVIGTSICCWTRTGQYDIFNDNHDNDLFLAIEPKRIWVNVFKGDFRSIYSGIATYDSKEMAIRWKDNRDPESYIKTIEITDEI